MKSFTPKHIPFLKISHPPSRYNLRRAEEVAQRRNENKTFQRWDLEKSECASLLNSFGEFETVYVTIDDLKRKSAKKENDSVGISHPALSSLGTDKERLRRFAGAPQFVFGGYYYSENLFLIDDIFEWSRHRISWSQVRTAQSIINEMRKNNV